MPMNTRHVEVRCAAASGLPTLPAMNFWWIAPRLTSGDWQHNNPSLSTPGSGSTLLLRWLLSAFYLVAQCPGAGIPLQRVEGKFRDPQVPDWILSR